MAKRLPTRASKSTRSKSPQLKSPAHKQTRRAAVRTPSLHDAQMLADRLRLPMEFRAPEQVRGMLNRVSLHFDVAQRAGDMTTARRLKAWMSRYTSSSQVKIDEAHGASRNVRGSRPRPHQHSIGELATAYFRRVGTEEWWIIGSGAPYGDGIATNPKLERVLAALKGAGIAVDERSMGFPGSCDSFTFTATFSEGFVEVTTGNYLGGRGGSVRGVEALKRLLKLLKLRVTSQTARRWNLGDRA